MALVRFMHVPLSTKRVLKLKCLAGLVLVLLDMPVRCSLLTGSGKKEKYTDLVPGDLWMVEEDFDGEGVNRIIAIYLPPDDYGAQVHELDPDERSLDES